MSIATEREPAAAPDHIDLPIPVPEQVLQFEKPLYRVLREHRGKLHLIAFLGAVILATPRLPQVLWGLPLIAVGIVVRTWAAGYIAKDYRLCTEGPYAYCRHPMYLGNFVVLIGLCICAGNMYLAAAALVTGSVLYYYAIRREENLLHRLFGEEFEQYRHRTPALVPDLANLRLTSGALRNFRWYLATYNGAWEQSGAVALLVILFVAKAVWFS